MKCESSCSYKVLTNKLVIEIKGGELYSISSFPFRFKIKYRYSAQSIIIIRQLLMQFFTAMIFIRKQTQH